MTEDNQIIPLAPARNHPRSDEEYYASTTTMKTKEEKSSKFLVYVLAGIVTLSIILLILAQFFLRATTPEFILSSVTAKNLRYGNSSSPYFNVTLVNLVEIKNKNSGYFDFGNSKGSVMYGSSVVGDMMIDSGRVRGKQTQKISVQVEVRSDGLSHAGKNLSDDLSSEILDISSHGRLSGKVNLMSITKKKTAEMSCTMSLNLTSQLIQDLLCT